MKNQTRPFTVVLLAPIAEQPIHALVAPSGDSILLSQDTKVSTLANIPDMIESEFGTYDEFLIEHRDQFMLFNQVASDLDPDLIFLKCIQTYLKIAYVLFVLFSLLNVSN